MPKYLLVVVSMFILATNRASAQFIDHQDARLIASHVVLGGISTGLGAVINKQRTEKSWPVFWKGFKYGCLGGSLLYTGKKLSHLIYLDEKYLAAGGWGSKLVHNAGLSIMENVSLHRPAFSHFNLHIGFVRIEADWQNDFKITPKVMVYNFVTFIYAWTAYNSTLNIEKTIKGGNFYFEARKLNIAYSDFDALTLKNNIIINNNRMLEPQRQKHVHAHEHVHTLQNTDYFIVNTYIYKPFSKLKKMSPFLRKISPYMFIDLSLMDRLYPLAKSIALNKYDCYWMNPYEWSAEKFALSKTIDIGDYCE